jgi:hypothetical protein
MAIKTITINVNNNHKIINPLALSYIPNFAPSALALTFGLASLALAFPPLILAFLIT